MLTESRLRPRQSCGGGDVAELESGVAGGGRSLAAPVSDGALADHGGDEAFGVEAIAGGLDLHAAAAEDGDVVGDGECLADLVGDEQDGVAVGLQGGEDAEEAVYLVGSEDAGGLVEDEEPGLGEEELDQLDALPLAEGEVVDAAAGVDLQAVVVGELLDAADQVAAADEAALSGEEQGDVLGDGESGDQGEVLKHHADAEPASSGGGAKADREAVDGDGAGVGGVVAVDDLHQGALAGPVLAEDGVYLTALHDEVDGVIGYDAGEGLGDPAQLEERRGAVRGG